MGKIRRLVKAFDPVRRPLGRMSRRILALSVVLFLGLGLFAATANEDDQGLLVRLLQDSLSDAGREVRIRGFQGALSSRATIESLSIADDQGVWLTLSGVVLDWNRGALLARRVEVNELSAQHIDLLRLPSTGSGDALPSPTARPEFSLPELPVSVRVGQVRADRMTIDASVTGQQAQLVLMGSALLEGGQGTAAFTARRTDGVEGEFVFEGAFDNASRQLALELVLSEGPEGIASTLLGIPDRPSMALSVAGAGPLGDFAADINLATDGVERVTGAITFTDSSPDSDLLDGLSFTADIGGDLRPLVVADLHPFFGAESRLRAQGARSERGEIDLSELTINTRTMRLVGRAALDADGLPRMLDVIADIARDDGEPVVLPGTNGEGRLGMAELNIEYDAAVSRDWRIVAGVDRLLLPELSVARVDLQAQGRLSPGAASGGTAEPLFDGVFDFSALGIQAADPALQRALGQAVSGFMSVSMATADSVLELGGLSIEGETVSLTGYGNLDGTRFDGFIEAEAPDLAAFSGLAGRALGGHALFTMRGMVGLLTGAFDLDLALRTTDLTIDQREFDNLVAGRAEIQTLIARDLEGTRLQRLALNAGALRFEASGELRPDTAQVQGSFTIDDLGALGPGYGGALSADAGYDNDGAVQRLRLAGTARDLVPGDLPGADAVRALLAGETRLRVELEIEDERYSLPVAAIEGRQLLATASGVWSEAETDIVLDLARFDIDGIAAGMSGRLGGQARLSGDAAARRLDVQLSGQGPLRSGVPELDGLLSGSVALVAGVVQGADGALEVETARLRAPGLLIEASGRQGADGDARFRLDGDIDNLARAVPGIAGSARVEARVARLPQVPEYIVSFSARGPSTLSLEGSGRVAEDFGTVSLRATGQLDAALANPRIEPFSVRGPIRFEASMEGPPRIESLRARATLENGRFVQPNIGVSFQNVTASAEAMGLWTRLRIGADGSRGGRVEIEGSMALDRRRDADLNVRADALRVAMPGLFEAIVTGDARISGPMASAPRLSGRVQIVEAEISIPNSPLGRTGFVPDGLRHVNESAASVRTREFAGISEGMRNGDGRVPMLLDLVLDAPGRVFVRGRGLDAELGGSLRLGGTTQTVVPSGSFGLIRGRLDLLGNRFVLTDGSASMIGSFIPYIRLVATTDSGGVVTSIILEGEADKPEISFTSVPELPQDEVLARLIFRRSLTSLSPFQAAQLALSVATLTGYSDSSLMTRARLALGLDDLDLTTDDEGNTALRLGRYISERVYTDVSVDSAGLGEVSINLELSSSITLRGRTDTEGRSGVGIFFERDY